MADKTISGTAVINSVRLAEQAGDPSTPATGYWQLFIKSGGVYAVNDAGTVVGPFAAGGGYPTYSGAILTKSSTQAVSTATETAISFDGEALDTDAYHDNVTNNTRLTAPANGYYLVGGAVAFYGLADSKSVIVRINKNGAKTDGDVWARHTTRSIDTDGAFPVPFLSRPLQLNSGEYVELTAEHNHGSDRNVRESTNGTGFWIVRLA